MTLNLLGFPTDEWERYSGSFHNTVGHHPGTPEFEYGQELVAWVSMKCAEMTAERMRHPADDATSKWLTYEIDGKPIDPERVTMLLFHFMGGGTETTGSLLASVLNYLSEHPEHRQRLLDDPDFMDLATEEFLRVFPPAKAHGRVVLEDTEIDGCQKPSPPPESAPYAQRNTWLVALALVVVAITGANVPSFSTGREHTDQRAHDFDLGLSLIHI